MLFCWIGTIIPAGYVFIEAIKSMDGTIHGFHGERLYGIDAFIDTIFMYIAFFFPLFIVWGACLFGAIVSTLVICLGYRKKRCRN